MHTGVENEILSTLKIIAAQNKEMIDLISGYLGQSEEKKKEDGKAFSEILGILYETGAINAVGNKFADFVKEYNDRDQSIGNAKCDD